ncbi:MAG: serine/threonine-protein kinase [Enterobacterales bacterium]|nr:serine/threonine-protein kinase [Enterobacterales bacterium]
MEKAAGISLEIPGYKILKTLGIGGQATVYLAIQKGFDREVALKVMSPALAADPSFGERFIREAKIVAQLSHDRIVTVYDVGKSDNFYYLAMEYMRGEELKSKISQGLKAKDALQIIAKLAKALHFAHQKGYIHRDVKSENILFNDDDQPVLTDFGIAKASNSSTQMTQTGKLIGTPEYMSPEQCRGKDLDGRSDLYSLGIILL